VSICDGCDIGHQIFQILKYYCQLISWEIVKNDDSQQIFQILKYEREMIAWEILKNDDFQKIAWMKKYDFEICLHFFCEIYQSHSLEMSDRQYS